MKRHLFFIALLILVTIAPMFLGCEADTLVRMSPMESPDASVTATMAEDRATLTYRAYDQYAREIAEPSIKLELRRYEGAEMKLLPGLYHIVVEDMPPDYIAVTPAFDHMFEAGGVYELTALYRFECLAAECCQIEDMVWNDRRAQCVPADDQDGDMVLDVEDNCIQVPNATQEDADNDALGDACDTNDGCTGAECCEPQTTTWNGAICVPNARCLDETCCVDEAIWDAAQGRCINGITDCVAQECCGFAGSVWDPSLGRCVNGYVPVDTDQDSVEDVNDNCPNVPNATQFDLDSDDVGNACDIDVDGDGVNDGIDNCTFTVNADQLDADGDGAGDPCDPDNNPTECIEGGCCGADTVWNGGTCVPSASCLDASCCTPPAIWDPTTMHCVNGITECVGGDCCDASLGIVWDPAAGTCILADPCQSPAQPLLYVTRVTTATTTNVPKLSMNVPVYAVDIHACYDLTWQGMFHIIQSDTELVSMGNLSDLTGFVFTSAAGWYELTFGAMQIRHRTSLAIIFTYSYWITDDSFYLSLTTFGNGEFIAANTSQRVTMEVASTPMYPAMKMGETFTLNISGVNVITSAAPAGRTAQVFVGGSQSQKLRLTP